MPYISKREIDRIRSTDVHANEYICTNDIDTPGEMQYAVAIIVKSFIDRRGLNYQNCNDVMGALAGAQMEFYRRVVSKYEDEAIERNGDVYGE